MSRAATSSLDIVDPDGVGTLEFCIAIIDNMDIEGRALKLTVDRLDRFDLSGDDIRGLDDDFDVLLSRNFDR